MPHFYKHFRQLSLFFQPHCRLITARLDERLYPRRKHETVVNLCRGGRPTKMTPGAQRRITKVTKEPRRVLTAGLLCSFRTWTTYCDWWSHDFCSLSKNPEGEPPAICLSSSWRTIDLCSRTMIKNHTNKSTSDCTNKMNVLALPTQRPHLSGANPIQMLSHDPTNEAHAQKLSSMVKLKQFCKREWTKTSPQRRERHKRLTAVVAVKGGPNSF